MGTAVTLPRSRRRVARSCRAASAACAASRLWACASQGLPPRPPHLERFELGDGGGELAFGERGFGARHPGRCAPRRRRRRPAAPSPGASGCRPPDRAGCHPRAPARHERCHRRQGRTSCAARAGWARPMQRPPATSRTLYHRGIAGVEAARAERLLERLAAVQRGVQLRHGQGQARPARARLPTGRLLLELLERAARASMRVLSAPIWPSSAPILSLRPAAAPGRR